jgi:hypothetical protein
VDAGQYAGRDPQESRHMTPRTAAWWRITAPVYRLPTQPPEPIFAGKFRAFLEKQDRRQMEGQLKRRMQRIRIFQGGSVRISFSDEPSLRSALKQQCDLDVSEELQPCELLLSFPSGPWLALDVRYTAEERLEFGCVIPGSKTL